MSWPLKTIFGFLLLMHADSCKSFGGYSITPVSKSVANPTCAVAATAIFTAASGKSIDVRDYVGQHRTPKASHTLDEIVKMVSDQSFDVCPVEVDAQGLFGIIQKPIIAHLATAGLPGHFVVVLPLVDDWIVLDPQLDSPLLLSKSDIFDIAFSGTWIIHRSDYLNLISEHRKTAVVGKTAIVAFCVIFGAMLIFASQAVLRTRKVLGVRSRQFNTTTVALLISFPFFCGCHQDRLDLQTESTNTPVHQLSLGEKALTFESANFVILDRVDFPSEVAVGDYGEVVAHLKNIGACSLGMENFLSGSPCCATFVLKSLSSNLIEPGDSFTASYRAYAREDGMAETLEIQISDGDSMQVIVAPSTIRVVSPAYRVLGPIDVDFGELNNGDDAVVNQSIIVRSASESFLGNEAISITTDIAELTADVGDPEFVGIQLMNHQWNVPVTFRLNTEKLEQGTFAYDFSGHVNDQLFKIKARGKIRYEWSLSGSLTPRILVRNGRIIPASLRLMSSHSGYTINCAEIANSELIAASVIENDVLQLSLRPFTPESMRRMDESATISLVVTPSTGSELKLNFHVSVSRR